jgi:uncharacterized membrane protein
MMLSRQGFPAHQKAMYALTAFFGVLYGLVTFVNHALFRTYAFDLGIKNQTLWYFAHGKMAYSSLLPELQGDISIFANHFEPILVFLAPFWWILGSWTLLVAQWAFVLWGGWGIYKLTQHWTASGWTAVAMAWLYYWGWGFFSAFGYDFHTNVLAAGCIPWALYYLWKQKVWAGLAVTLLWLSCKETQGLLLFFVGTGCLPMVWKQKKQRFMALGLAGLGLLWFGVVMKVVMPHFAEGRITYFHFHYSALGENGGDLIQSVLSDPISAIKLMFTNPYEQDKVPGNDKLKFILAMVWSGGFLLVLRPAWIWMMVPILLQKLWSDQPAHWGPFFHYNAELMPLLVLGLARVSQGVFTAPGKQWLLALLVLAAPEVTRRSLIWYRLYPWAREAVDFSFRPHYQRSFPVNELRSILKKIPEDASVAATDFVVPHLASRPDIFVLPDTGHAHYILKVMDDRDLPPDQQAALSQIQPKIQDEILWQEGPFLLWKRHGP